MDIQDTVLVVVDVQGKLAELMFESERLFGNIQRAIHFCQILQIPILWTEQAPDKIGLTVEPIASLLAHSIKPIHKRSFSCWGCEEFKDQLNKLNRRQILLVGIEAHVCLFQTAVDLCRHGYQVYVAVDAVSSKTQANRDMAIERMKQEGIILTSAEMAACEFLRSANHPHFKEVMSNIKR